MNWTEFSAVCALAIIAITSPGPSFVVVLNNSLSGKRGDGLLTAAGIALGDMTLALVNILGLGVLIMESPILFKFIKYVGAAYLVYLGIKGIMSKPRDSIDLNILRSTKNNLITGYVTVLLNPKALIFFLSLFTLVVSPETPLYDRTIYVATISLISFSWFTGAALIFTNHHIKKRVFKHIHIIERGLGVAIIVIAIVLLF